MLLSKNKFEAIDSDVLLSEKLVNKKTDEILIIVPTNRKVRSLTKNVLENSIEKVLSGLHIHTLSTLSFLIFEEIFKREYFILDDATAIIKLKKIFSELDLKYFPVNQEITQGILLEIKNVISEFKKKGITVELLKNDLEFLSGSEKNKAEDLIKIYERYQAECYDKNLFELGDVYKIITDVKTEKFRQSFKELFPKIDTVIVKGFDELSLLEIKIINSIFDFIEKSFISFEINETNYELFSHPMKTVIKLKSFGFNEVPHSDRTNSNLFQEIIQKNLFTIKPEVQQSDVKVFLHSAQNRNEEISFIAKKIKNLILESNYKTEDICVIFNQISNYSSIVDEIFSDYDIPFNLTDRYLLSNSSPIISLISLLEILDNNFYYKNIFRALSGEWIDLPSIDKNNLLKVSVNLKIISGLDNWERKINNVLNDIELNFDYDSHYLPKEAYLKAQEDIQTIAKVLEPFSFKLTPNQFFKEINNLIIQLGIVSKAVNNQEKFVEKNTRALTEFVEMLFDISEILEIEYGNQKQSLNFYLDKIRAATQFTRYNIKEKPGVLITSVDEIRGLNFKVLFLGGLVDGEFPTKYSPEVFIPHKYKILEEGHLFKERYKFYQALSVANEQIILTYPKNHDNSELTVSSFLNEIKSIVEYEEINAEDYETIICSTFEMKKKLSIESLKKVDDKIISQHKINLADVIKKSEFDYQRRKSSSEKSNFNGYLDVTEDDEIKQYFERFSYQQSYSASKLEEFVKCPFKFLMKRILNLQPYKEPTEEVEAFEIGTLIHSILFQFYTEIKKKNLVIEKCSDEQFEELCDIIFRIAESRINKENFENVFSFFDLEKILGINGNRKYSILYRFLEEERKQKNGFNPFLFEKNFGKYSDTSKVQYNGINLQGTIDRIDVNEEQKLFSVIDYKLRRKSISKDDINNGISLQLPLYLFAAKQILQAEFGDSYKPYSAEIYSLNIFKDEFGRKIIHNSNAKKISSEDLITINNSMIDIFTQTVEKCVEKIKNGEFHLSTLKDREKKVCYYCEFRNICRVDEII